MKLAKYKASKELEAWLLQQAGPHYVCHDGRCVIDSLEGLQNFRALHGDSFAQATLPVFPYKDDSPFSEEADAAYQAYHDRLHAEGGYQFDIAGEYKLACYHYHHAKSDGLCEEDCLVLFHHVASRVMYHYYHDGQDPPCRATFISACFAYGTRIAAKGCHEDQMASYFC